MRYIHFIITFPNKCEADQEKDLFEYVHMYFHMPQFTSITAPGLFKRSYLKRFLVRYNL